MKLGGRQHWYITRDSSTRIEDSPPLSNNSTGTMITPILSFLTSVFVVSIALHHDHRLWALPLISIPAWISLTTAHELHDLAELWAMGLVVYFMHNASVLYFEQWVLPRPSPTKRYDFTAAYKIWSNPQLLGTSQQVPGAPRRATDAPPETRLRFAIIRILRVAAYTVLLYLSTVHLFPGAFLPFTKADFAPVKQVYFRRLLGLHHDPHDPSGVITVRETALRILTATHWILASYLTLNASRDTLAVFFTCILRLDEPSDWPARLFGNPREAFTLRRFWGRFWHRLIYRSYGHWGRFVAQRLLGSRRRQPGNAEKWCIALAVFFLSGVLHAVVTKWALHLEVDLGPMGDVGWYCMNFAAGALERAVLGLVRGLFGPQLDRWETRVPGLQRMWQGLGFVWVLAFFCWSVPKKEYARGYAMLEEMENY